MKTIKPFGPSLGRAKVTNKFIKKINDEFNLKSNSSFKDYSSKLASQIKDEVKLSKFFVEKYLFKEIKKILKYF